LLAYFGNGSGGLTIESATQSKAHRRSAHVRGSGGYVNPAHLKARRLMQRGSRLRTSQNGSAAFGRPFRDLFPARGPLGTIRAETRFNLPRIRERLPKTDGLAPRSRRAQADCGRPSPGPSSAVSWSDGSRACNPNGNLGYLSRPPLFRPATTDPTVA
jgi:hypothetical protein